jgi:hypothetical protein
MIQNLFLQTWINIKILINRYMTEKFDTFVESLLLERYKRCKASTLPELSDNPRYIFSKCAPNPYTSGFKRIYYLRRGEALSLDKCKTNPRVGTARYEECRLAKIAYMKRMKKKAAMAEKKD